MRWVRNIGDRIKGVLSQKGKKYPLAHTPEQVRELDESSKKKIGDLKEYLDESRENYPMHAYNIKLFMDTLSRFQRQAKNIIKNRGNAEKIFKEFSRVTKEDFEEFNSILKIHFSDAEIRVLFFSGLKKK